MTTRNTTMVWITKHTLRKSVFTTRTLAHRHLLMILAFVAFPTPGFSADLANPDVAIETGKSALRTGWNYPWYNSSTDSLARINIQPPSDNKWLSEWLDWDLDSSWWTDWDMSNLMLTLSWFFIAAILGGAAYLLIQAYLGNDRRQQSASATGNAESTVSTIDHAAVLPARLRNPHTDLLAEAKRFYLAGNLVEAIVYLFSFQLVELDKHQLLWLAKGKTNRQYLAEVHRGGQISSRHELAAALRQTMILFEEAFFGSHAPRQEDFEACWSKVARFQILLATHSEAPAAPTPPPVKPQGPQTLLIALTAGAILLAGCGTNINTTYGRRSGGGAASVNGTAVLGEMFKKSGHDVHSWTSLSPSLSEADVIVWAPDDFDPPSARTQAWLNDWLRTSWDKKTLIYIGRDFDAAENYWAFAEQVAPTDQKREVSRRRTIAKNRHLKKRAFLCKTVEWPGWFSIDTTTPPQSITTLSGPWAKGINTDKIQIERHSQLIPKENSRTLLADGNGSPLVSEIPFSGGGQLDWEKWDAENVSDPSRLIVVENGSFLLNLPLVNHEHRKLAGNLVAEIGQPKKQVVFLQSHPGGPEVHDSDPSEQPPSGFDLFTVWPLNGVLVHLAALGFVFALARWPIFGLPRRLPPAALTDFGHHVTALGELMAKKGDNEQAHTMLKNYRHTVLQDDR